MEPRNGKENVCAVCGSEANSTCSSCKNIHYCSPAHQKQDWKTHRSACKSFKKDIDLSTGLEHVIASRDLKPGLIILEESAAFYAPKWIKQSTASNIKLMELSDLCLACGKELKTHLRYHNQAESESKISMPYFCSKCKWPLCGEHCEKDKLHNENECKLFSTHNVTFPPASDSSDEPNPSAKYTDLVSMVRGVGLRSLNLFGKIQGLQQNSLRADLQEDLATTSQNTVLQLKTILHHNAHFDELKTVSLENEGDLNLMCRIVRLNHFGIETGDQMWGQRKNALYMYFEACLFAHSCIPNCCWSVGEGPDYKIRIRSTVPIKKGEKLTLDRGFVPQTHYESTYERQLVLRERGIFCNCERCVDPTELGTYVSAIECPQCSQKDTISIENNLGYLLSTNPLDLGSVWACNACSFQVEADDMMERWKRLNNEVAVLRSTQEEEDRAGIYSNIYTRQDAHGTQWIELGQKLGLHPNHFAVFANISALVANSFDVRDVASVTAEAIQRRRKWLYYCLAIEDKLSPGLSGYRSYLLASLVTLIYRVLLNHEWANTLSLEELSEDYDIFDKASEDATKYFKNEFPETGETLHKYARELPKGVKALQLAWLDTDRNK